MTITKQQLQSAFDKVAALAEAIHSLGRVPSGHLYAQVMGVMSLAEYESCIRALKGAKLVSESNHELTWIGPRLEEKL